MHAQDNLPRLSDFDFFPAAFSGTGLLESAKAGGWSPESLASKMTMRSDWQAWEAIREFVQNALDISPQIQLLFEDKDKISYIVDDGIGIIDTDLLYGEEKRKTKQGIHCLRGTYGEGLKLSIITLMRLGHRVIIRTVHNDFFFAFEQLSRYRGTGQDRIEETTQKLWSFQRPNKITRGTVIAIEGIDCLRFRNRFTPFIIADGPNTLLISVKTAPEIIAQAKQDMLQLQDELTKLRPEDKYARERTEKDYNAAEAISLEDCKVRQVFNLPGELYVRDIYVTTSFAYFGYNFWFNDTKDVIPPNRNEFIHLYNITDEFEYIFKSKDVRFLEIFFDTLYRDIRKEEFKQFNKHESLEWKVLSQRTLTRITEEEANILYSIILKIVGNNFNWSENPQEQKLLEWFDIIDLREKLPNLRSLFVKYNLIKDIKDLARATTLLDQVIEITPEEIETAPLWADLDEADKKGIASALTKIKRELDCIIDLIQRKSKPTSIHFYAGNFEPEDEKVGGFYKRTSDQIFIHIKNMTREENILRVFIHELAHAECEDCKDVTAEFIRALQSIAARVFTYIRREECDFEEINDSTQFLDDYSTQLEAYAFEKSLKIGNPFGIIRPPEFDRDLRDKAAIDNAMVAIADGNYADYDHVKVVLMGFTSSGTYDPFAYNSRGRGPYTGKSWEQHRKEPLTTQQIIALDIETLKKIGLSVPIKAEAGDLAVEKWKELITHPWGTKLDLDLLVLGENWNDPEASIQMINSHPQPHIKTRNLRALLEFINPRELIDQQAEVLCRQYGVSGFYDLPDEIQEILAEDYRAGKLADPQWLKRLKQLIPTWAAMKHPTAQFDAYSYPFKDILITTCSSFNWLDTIQYFAKAEAPEVRKRMVGVYSGKNMLNEILEMERNESNLEVLIEILSFLAHQMSYGREHEKRGLAPSEFIPFFKANLARYQELANTHAGLDYVVKNFRDELAHLGENIKWREQHPKRRRR